MSAKYSDHAVSALECTVAAGDGTFDFKLSSRKPNRATHAIPTGDFRDLRGCGSLLGEWPTALADAGCLHPFPHPKADDQNRRQPGDDGRHAVASIENVEHIVRASQEHHRQPDENWRQPTGNCGGCAPC